MSLKSSIINPFSDDRSADSITGISELICMGRYALGPEKTTGISEIRHVQNIGRNFGTGQNYRYKRNRYK